MPKLKLFIVHCGFYDLDVSEGVYESHANFIVAAESFDEARVKVRLEPDFQKKKMHVDGLQMIDAVNGYRTHLEEDPSLDGKTLITSSRYHDFA